MAQPLVGDRGQLGRRGREVGDPQPALLGAATRSTRTICDRSIPAAPDGSATRVCAQYLAVSKPPLTAGSAPPTESSSALAPSASVIRTCRSTGPPAGSTIVRSSSRSSLRSSGLVEQQPAGLAGRGPLHLEDGARGGVVPGLGPVRVDPAEVDAAAAGRDLVRVDGGPAEPGGRAVRQRPGRAESGGAHVAAATDRVAEDLRVAGRVDPRPGAVEERQHVLLGVGEQVDRAGDVRRTDRLLLLRGQPVGVVRAAVAGRLAAPVVPGRRLGEARGPLGVEVVVVGAHHQDRALQRRVAGDQVAGGVGELLALQVGDVAVAVRQQRDGRDVRRGLHAEVRRRDEHLPGDPVRRRQRDLDRGAVDTLAAAAVTDQDDLVQVELVLGREAGPVVEVSPRRSRRGRRRRRRRAGSPGR